MLHRKTVKFPLGIILIAYFRRSYYLLTIPEIAIIAEAEEKYVKYVKYVKCVKYVE